MKIEFGYGCGSQTLCVPDENVLGVLQQNELALPEKTARELVAEAIAHPIGCPPLREIVHRGEKIAIVTSDITRPLPSYEILPELLRALFACGVEAADVTVVFAIGSHRRHTPEEMRQLAGDYAFETVRCVDSDPDDCVRLGVTDRGTPVDITRAVAEADRRICLGNVEFHWFAGYSGGAKAIIICNPSNPSGKVFTEEELKTIADLCIRYDVYAIMDEVYEHIIYDGRKHVYMNSIPGMWERTVSCSSLSKTYSVTGWRLGYAIAPENIMARIRQYHDFNAVGCPSPLMEAAVVGLNMPLSYYDEFGAHYAHMKKIFTEGMRDIGIPFTDPEGTYFVLADISPYLKKGQSDVDFCEQLARKAGVGAVPGSSFFNEPINNIVRLHFAKKDETLYAALDRLNHIKDMM